MAVTVGPAGRLLLAANRLAVTDRMQNSGVELIDAAGGLATGLRPWRQKCGGCGSAGRASCLNSR